MTIEGWDEDDGCTGDCCRRTEPDLNRLLAPGTRARLHAAHRVDTARIWVATVLWPTVRRW